ncbi:MAG TPA: DNA primase [Stellaceae bacterium]|nr:DNA primase [Stellaceae bacterium]
MAFPPRFLDELRERLSLADIVGRRVRLIKRGREYVGLCPFHKEKTPSFNVVEDKGFYHCFGCGAHGDVIGFTMQTANLTFPEAVEQLAHQAGLEVPRQSREERDRAERQASVQGAVEAACAHFESLLASPAGREARVYLERRGLDPATIRRFRLGYAAEQRDGLKRALAGAFPEPLLIEAGLLRRAESGETYDYFRHRIMFPIGDRQGRIIAFGGRVLGDGQPKYLNSPDTPLFQKGRVLYGWAQARAGLAQAKGESPPSVIVTEGYMDVIALHRAGFSGAVAPLGTALTEQQIEELWRLLPEPVLCFDGDAAGLRAQLRALDRALPLLKPGHSLRFATLPAGEDPDTLVLKHGTEAMRDVLDRAKPLADVLWEIETARPIDTPERRAALEQRLDARVRVIADRTVQEHYRSFCRERLFALGGRRSGTALRRPRRGGAPSRRFERPGPPEPAPAADPTLLRHRQQEVLLAALINHTFLVHEVAEELATLELSDPRLDKLCHEILRLHALNPDLDAETLKLHLTRNGYAGVVQGVLSPQVLQHAAFARPEADTETVRMGWIDARDRLQHRHLRQQVDEAAQDFLRDVSDETWGRLQQTVLDTKKDDDGATGGGVR